MYCLIEFPQQLCKVDAFPTIFAHEAQRRKGKSPCEREHGPQVGFKGQEVTIDIKTPPIPLICGVQGGGGVALCTEASVDMMGEGWGLLY